MTRRYSRVPPDIIFCRNVLIDFDIAAKADVLQRMARQLAPDGVVVLGESETTLASWLT